ncbi:hypothetical protein AB0B89_12970 [Sphaerisporangium sp. NPDC049002]|uniref:hypothetical protein n=1 Tax=unclassified Sphaerisporangium TaxID=2630420 RepID=UPI0033ECA7D9
MPKTDLRSITNESASGAAVLELSLVAMTMSEPAVAPHAYEMTTERITKFRPSLGKLGAWVKQGTERLDGDVAVWWRDYQTRRLNLRTAGRGEPLSPRERVKLRRTGEQAPRQHEMRVDQVMERGLWPDRRREQFAHAKGAIR